MNRIGLTLLITWLYCVVWMILESVIYGIVENRLVDNIMMFLFIPIIYVATAEVIKPVDWKKRRTEIYIVLRNGMKKAIRIIIDVLAVGVVFMLGIVGYGFYAFGYIWQSLHWTVIPCCILGAMLCWGAAGWIMNRVGKSK